MQIVESGGSLKTKSLRAVADWHNRRHGVSGEDRGVAEIFETAFGVRESLIHTANPGDSNPRATGKSPVAPSTYRQQSHVRQ